MYSFTISSKVDVLFVFSDTITLDSETSVQDCGTIAQDNEAPSITSSIILGFLDLDLRLTYVFKLILIWLLRI